MYFIPGVSQNAEVLSTDQSIESPILNDVNLKYNTVTFNGSLFGDHIWRQWVGDDVDQAWLDLGVECRPVPV